LIAASFVATLRFLLIALFHFLDERSRPGGAQAAHAARYARGGGGVRLHLQLGEKAADTLRVLAKVGAAVARGRAHVDPGAAADAFDADADIIGKADHGREVGRLDRAGPGRLGGRRLGRRDLPLELAHGLLDQLEGFLGRPVHHERAQVWVGRLLLGGDAGAGIARRIGIGRPCLGESGELRRRGHIGGDVVDLRQVEEGRQKGQGPRRHRERQQDAEGRAAGPAVAASPDADQRDEPQQHRERRDGATDREKIDRGGRGKGGNPMQPHPHQDQARGKEGAPARPARERRDHRCRSMDHGRSGSTFRS